MADVKKKTGFSRLWQWADEIILAGALYPLFKGLAMKGIEIISGKVEKKIAEGLGFDTEGAAKDPTDEILFQSAEFGLAEQEVERLQAFENWLREKSPERAQAYILFVAKAIKLFEREEKKIQNPGKGEKGPRTETSFKDINEGVQWAVKFFREMLKRQSHEEIEKFLEGKNVFSLVSQKKPAPFLEKLKGVSEQMVRDFKDTSSSEEFLSRAKQAYENSKAKRRA